MLPEKVVKLTLPFFPFIQPGETRPRKSVRVRPRDALDLEHLMEAMSPSLLATVRISGKPWSVISVYSPYSPDIHVMLMESSTDRYLPGPEWTPDDEGDGLMRLWTIILEFLARREENATIHAGYNWSPRSWGLEEEKTGFQSVPTKWHPMLWGWPPFAEEGGTGFEWIDAATLSEAERRILGENDYAEPFGAWIKERLENSFSTGPEFRELFPAGNWRIDGRGIEVRLEGSVLDVLGKPGFFRRILGPLSRGLEGIMRDLTEALTSIDCRRMDAVLRNVERGELVDLDTLRAAPSMRGEDEIRDLFADKGIPPSLLELVLDPLRRRCREEGDPYSRWRKGFGYSLVFGGSSRGRSGTLRIMPGIYIGPGGVVEAEGVVIERPEVIRHNDGEALEKSRGYWALKDWIRSQSEGPLHCNG